MSRIGNKLPFLPNGGGGADDPVKIQSRMLEPPKKPAESLPVRPSELKALHSAGPGAPNDIRSDRHAFVDGNIERLLLRALLPGETTRHLLRPHNVRQSLDDLKSDWAQLIDDQGDPLLQVAELSLEHCDLELRDLQRTLHLLIEP